MRKLILACIVAAVLVATACGGGDDKKTSVAATPGDTTATTVAGSPATTGNSDFDAILDKASKTPFRVTYKISGKGSDDNVFTLSQDGKGKSAYFAGDGDTQLIIDGDTVISCSDLKSTPQCTQASGATAKTLSAVYTGLFLAPQSAIAAGKAGGYGNTSSETIAGRDATCVSVDYSAASWKYCADKESGVVLKWAGSAGGESGSIEATEAGAPKDSDFTPPATPTTTPAISLPPGITLPSGITLPGG